MSLDVYLEKKGFQVKFAEPRIFVRENGACKEISREEWDNRFPGREPVVVSNPDVTQEVYWANITHNLNRMADEAGIYKHLWRPDEIGVTKAEQLIEPLRDGLAWLNSDPDKFKKLNPPNGWGTCEELTEFVAKYLAACEQNPDADVRVSR